LGGGVREWEKKGVGRGKGGEGGVIDEIAPRQGPDLPSQYTAPLDRAGTPCRHVPPPQPGQSSFVTAHSMADIIPPLRNARLIEARHPRP